jgi:hypothetical protein
MASIKTGNGGFEIDGKVYDFDVGDPNAPGLDPTNEDHGDIKVDDSKKDLGKKTRSTLGKYLSDVTKGKQGSAKGNPNSFTVDPPQSPNAPDEISISDEKGRPAPITPTRNSTHFLTSVDSAHPQGSNGTVYDSPDLRQSSGTVPDPTTKLGDLGKGKQGKKVDGHGLLHNVTKDKTPEPIESYRTTVLTTNRFTADRRMSDDSSYKIGDRTYSRGQLKQVGVMLSLRGSQEFPSAFQTDVNPVNAGNVAGALIPSPNQLGILKVPGRLTEARDALESLSNNDDEPASVDIAPLGHQSWGALNNVEEPWAGLLNLGMVAMALALQVTLLLVFEGLGALIGLLDGSGGPPSIARKFDGTYTKGSFLAKPPQTSDSPPNIMHLLGIHGTRFPFGDALKVGASAFFVGGEKAKEGVGSQLVGALTSAVGNALSDANSSGFLIIVSRTIVRSGQVIAAQIDKIASAFASNPISGIKAIIGLLEVIKQSKLISAINIFTTLGDAILSEDESTLDKDADPGEKSAFSTIDVYPADAAGASVRKNRLKGAERVQKTKLAWSSNRAPATYLLPDSVATMTLVDAKLGSFKGPFGATDADSKGAIFIQTEADRQQNGARLPRQSTDPEGVDVKKMEALLESEYMPFYFHDLRTNEIISFHAFMASLTDDYTASWESIDGYGRVDPIKIYKSTGRRIGMSFYVVATSKSDFDEMWLKLNKLVTLVYPQYTKGRMLSDGTTQFVQPFSQLIGASPLIRIRLGDLLRSNYSRFALARLFGAADGDMKLGGDIKFEGAQGIIEQAKGKLEKATEDLNNEWHIKTADWPGAMEPAGSSLPVSLSGPSNPSQAATLNIAAGDLPYFKFKIKNKKPIGNGMAVCEVMLLDIDEIVESYGFDSETALLQKAAMNAKYNDEKNPTTKVLGGEEGYAIPFAMLSLTRKSFKKILKQSGAGSAIENIDKLSTFLDIEKNALVKSFRAVQGKGLGGVIETMNFDWYDKVTWEIDPDHRAPKMCKVTLTFAPIHDISPGIDHLGYNRAPVYPAGAAMGLGLDPDMSG